MSDKLTAMVDRLVLAGMDRDKAEMLVNATYGR